MQSLQIQLERLRARPYNEKMAIATGAGLGVAALLFIVWLLSWTLSPPSFTVNSASAISGFEQAQKAQQQLQATVDEMSKGYRNTDAILKELQAMDPVKNPATANFVQLHTDEQGNVVVEQVDVRGMQIQGDISN